MTEGQAEEMFGSSSNRREIWRYGVLVGLLTVALTAISQNAMWAGWQENELSVKAEDYGFTPAFVTVPVETRVTWTNIDPELHTVTSDDGGFSGAIGPGETFTMLFREPGVFFYYCQPHDWMIGEITVVSGSGR